MTNAPLTVDDIFDVRAYERERDEHRQRIIAMKRSRRVSVGPVITFVFENRDTIWFQIQEMARAERIFSDSGIQTELDTYNPLIPDAGELSATMYIELTDRAQMEHWLPRLVGVEQAVRIELSDGQFVSCDVDPEHAANLTRESVTAAVHFVRFGLTSGQIERFRTGPVSLSIAHREYRERTELAPETRASLLKDLLG